jgi:hypothetical protein
MGCGSSNADVASPHEAPADMAAAGAGAGVGGREARSTSAASQASERAVMISPAMALFDAAPPEPEAGKGADQPPPPPLGATIAGVNTPSDVAAIIERVPRARAENLFGFGKSADEAKPGQGKFVIYYMIKIRLESASGVITHITVYRRYSQFELLREKLLRERKKYGGTIPVLPKKKYFGALRNLDFLNGRQHDLDIWLSAVNRLPFIEENEFYNLFLMEEADDAPPEFVVLKTVDAIGLAKIMAAHDDTFSDDESEMSDIDSEVGTVSGNNDRAKSFDRGSGAGAGGEEGGGMLSGLPPLPSISEVAVNTEFNAATLIATAAPVPAAPELIRTRSPSIRAAFELGAKRTPKIFFDGILSFGTGVDSTGKFSGARIRKKTTLYYVLKIRYTDEQKCLQLDIIVYRRYSEFEKLRDNLLSSSLHGDIPLLPKKKLFGRTNSNIDHALLRKEELQEWLNIVGTYPHICSDEYYKAFVTKGANKAPEDFVVDDCFKKM